MFARPLESVFVTGARVLSIWRATRVHAGLGDVIGHGAPGLVTVRHDGPETVVAGTPLIVMSDDGSLNIALALAYVGFADGRWLRAMQLKLSPAVRRKLRLIDRKGLACSILNDPELIEEANGTAGFLMARRGQIVGVVAQASDPRTLRVEIVRTDVSLHEGRLLETEIAEQIVTYQLLSGLTHQDVLAQKNTRGFVIATARKIGWWNASAQRFTPVGWLPAAKRSGCPCR